MSTIPLATPRAGANRRMILAITAVAALGGLLFGYDTGVIGGSQLYFTKYFQLTPGEQGWAVSSAIYGCLFGALLSGYLTKAISRKYTLILSAFLFFLSAWGSGVADSLTELVLYRILGGLGVGMASMAAPMYIAEIAPPKERGQMVAYYQLAVVIGFFVVFLATYFIGGGNTAGMSAEEIAQLHTYNVERGWRVMLWSELLPAGAFFILLFFVPHTPRWLMMKGRTEEAKQVLAKITDGPREAQLEFDDIALSFSTTRNHHPVTLATKGIAFVLFMGIMLSIFQQVSGINAILYYGAEIFSNALGYGPEDALKQQLWLGAVNLAFTFVAIFTIDKWGRKPLFLLGTGGMVVGLSVLAWTLYSQQMGVVSLIAVLVFIGSFALSMGPVVWVMLAEIFPNNIRSVAMSIAVAVQWLFNAIVANSFPVINGSDLNQQAFNGALPYLIFAGCCVVAMIFVWKLVPETKGKTLEEMEVLWTGEKAAFHSAEEIEPGR
ncbi:sugar porter family MFS transporter [Pseudomaricurvus alcaniphilus]|uniref:sugar porter family MFS transporter n=1 Tax=Pseudomaricurvus alcaniphilus TaxID=1166482 RepID=UPI00140D0757|nr:sugar porter family MFS transporter [Pseudomaricurvus alcaniphilus]NHN37361.1 sugar porter family MFS transporter [Pseudomaricurvus alcaniphilus]